MSYFLSTLYHQGAAELNGNAGRLPAVLIPLRERSFRLLWAGRTVSSIGDGLQLVALTWLVIERTGSSVALSGVFLAAILPRIIFTIAGGVVSDRRAPRSVMLWSDALRALIVAALALFALSDSLPLLLMYVLVATQSTVGAFFGPASTAIVPRIVSRETLPAANALSQFANQLTVVVGAPLGGVAVAWLGSSGALMMNATSFAIAALATAQIPYQQPVGLNQEPSSPIRDAWAGIAFVGRSIWLRPLLLLDAALNVVLAGPMAIALPFLARDVLHVGSSGFGLLSAALGAGSICGALAAGAIAPRQRRGLVYCLLVLVQAPFVLLLGIGPFAVALVAIAIIGCLNGIGDIVQIGLLQEQIPPEMFGRTMSVSMLSGLALQPVSQLGSGFLAGPLGPQNLFTVAAIGTALAASAGLLASALRKID